MRPEEHKLELAIPYCVATALPDVGRSICHVVCQRETLPRAMLREPQKFGPHVHVKPFFYKAIVWNKGNYIPAQNLKSIRDCLFLS